MTEPEPRSDVAETLSQIEQDFFLAGEAMDAAAAEAAPDVLPRTSAWSRVFQRAMRAALLLLPTS